MIVCVDTSTYRLHDGVSTSLGTGLVALEDGAHVAEGGGDVEVGLLHVHVVLGVSGGRQQALEHGLAGLVGHVLQDHQGLLVAAAADGVEHTADLQWNGWKFRNGNGCVCGESDAGWMDIVLRGMDGWWCADGKGVDGEGWMDEKRGGKLPCLASP